MLRVTLTRYELNSHAASSFEIIFPIQRTIYFGTTFVFAENLVDPPIMGYKEMKYINEKGQFLLEISIKYATNHVYVPGNNIIFSLS